MMNHLKKYIGKYFKFVAQRFVFIVFIASNFGVMHAKAGSYDDFFAAIKTDDVTVVQQLLARGFDANTPAPDGQRGLILALREPALKAAAVLIASRQIDLNLLNNQGESPLMMAALKGHTELASRMLKKGADVNKTGWTPLHYAATSGQLALISLLLENHAYIDAESPNGTTPLMMASMYGTVEAVKLLLDEGADPLIKNEKAMAALQFAENAKRLDVAELIVKAIRRKRPVGQW